MEIIKKYYRNSGSVVNLQHEFGRELGPHHGLSAQPIRFTVKEFERKYTLLDFKVRTSRDQ